MTSVIPSAEASYFAGLLLFGSEQGSSLNAFMLSSGTSPRESPHTGQGMRPQHDDEKQIWMQDDQPECGEHNVERRPEVQRPSAKPALRQKPKKAMKALQYGGKLRG